MTSHGAGNISQQLCELLLEIVGRNAGRVQTARRHVRVLDAATPHMTVTQKAEARRRIRRLETKWGPLLAGAPEMYGAPAENCEISPEERVAEWLSTRRNPERLLTVLHRAALAVWEGETSLSNVMERAYAKEIDRVVRTVGYDSFREWLLELRIAFRTSRAVYRPGALCAWWVTEMEPTKRNDTLYAVCLRQVQEIKARRTA